jgi:DNA-binding PadR family transcriptional regulator
MAPSRTPKPADARPPLTETEFLILLVLSSGPKHGYAVMKAVAGLSGGRVTLGTGTLYGALKRMLDRRWIVRRAEKNSIKETGRIRKVYALADAGKDLLQAELGRLHSLVQAARLVKAGQKP